MLAKSRGRYENNNNNNNNYYYYYYYKMDEDQSPVKEIMDYTIYLHSMLSI